MNYFLSNFAGLEGYFDIYHVEDGTVNEKNSIRDFRRQGIPKIGKKYLYEFIISPNDAFLNENKVLPPGLELKLVFDRLKSDFSVFKLDGEDTLRGSVLELKDVYAQVEYISSPALRNYHDRLESMPLDFTYDDTTVMCKLLPQGETCIRIENLRGGNTPDYVFMGIIPTDALNGSSQLSSLKFETFGIQEVNITLNGNSCHGFPIKVTHDNPLWLYYKFLDNIGRLGNSSAGTQMKLLEFKKNMLISHKFEGEESPQGWIGLSLILKEAFKTSHTLGKQQNFETPQISFLSGLDCQQYENYNRQICND